MPQQPTEPDEAGEAGHCRLSHRLFQVFGNPVFRRSQADSVPVMVVSLGEREALLPLTAVQQEFGITPESEDGRMLALVAAALDFVSALRVGDPLPSEILSGEASWEPAPQHRDIATDRLRMQLVEWLSINDSAPDALLSVVSNPPLRHHVEQALTRAAEVLALASPQLVLQRIEQLGAELAYIESLRDRLLRRVRNMSVKVERLTRNFRGGATQVETLGQVRRLSAIALRQITARFQELDSRTGDIITALRNVEQQRRLVREHRDWLYRSQRAWDPILAEWDVAGDADEGTLSLLNRAYRFLAPRFMPVTEWISAMDTRRAAAARHPARMIW